MNTVEKSLDKKIEKIRDSIVGIDKEVELLDGTSRQYVFFDNAASTPSFKRARDKVNELLEWYSAIHRGQGIKSFIATEAYDEAHRIVANFVNADPELYTVIFVKNTTEAINKLNYRLNLKNTDVVLSTGMEHHSNDLPWRRNNFIDYIKTDENGYLDINDLYKKIEQYGKRIKLITVTGASNVSGFVNPYHEIAEIAHSIGAKILVDAAQLAPHRKIDMLPCDDTKHIDYLVMSAHKLYAPFGTGVLICPRETCENGDPEFVGGGMAAYVTHYETIWADLPDREEAGSPNTIGGIAMAAALKELDEIGMDFLENHEHNLTEYFLNQLESIPEIKTLVKTDFDRLDEKLGVITFNIEGMHYNLVGSILAHEFGIGLRTGCFCTQPYIAKLMNISDKLAEEMKDNIVCKRKIDLPGAIRISFGIYNTKEEVDYLLDSLKKVISGDYNGIYNVDESTGTFTPEGFEFNYQKYFEF